LSLVLALLSIVKPSLKLVLVRAIFQCSSDGTLTDSTWAPPSIVSTDTDGTPRSAVETPESEQPVKRVKMELWMGKGEQSSCLAVKKEVKMELQEDEVKDEGPAAKRKRCGPTKCEH
jgi:hypothetical protein